ncbi:MAG: TraB/GumN family protein [Bdellovibrionales bacterium]|nr:TraB/GumN family protein [Bdellovibrionales bacterium]
MEEIRWISKEDNVDYALVDGKEIYLVGTAHVSAKSVELAEETIRNVQPDNVAVELCDPRYQSLQDPDRWKNMDIIQVIKEGKAYVLLAQLMLAGFQKKLGEHLKVKPGAEMMAALAVAKETGANITLADRNIRVTLKRTWASLGLWSMLKVISAMIVGLFSGEKFEEEDIERLKSSDALEELMREFSDALPEVRTALIDERDMYLASKIREAEGQKIVAIIGAGHVPGIKKWINKPIDRDALEVIPSPKKLTKTLAYCIPLLVFAIFIYGFYAADVETSMQMIKYWLVINGAFGGLGALLAAAHPITIISAVIVSPFTSLNVTIAAGWIAGLVEAYLKKPRVKDLELIADDMSTVKGFYTNRVSHILVVMALTNLMGSIGTFIGIERIISLLPPS